MAASKNRLLWTQVPAGVRSAVETIAGAPVIAAETCPGGFSPGLASRLGLANGDRAFVKAIDGREWPSQLAFHRDEARIAAALPPGVPAPRLRGSYDDGEWVALVFDDVAGREPPEPWTRRPDHRAVHGDRKRHRPGAGHRPTSPHGRRRSRSDRRSPGRAGWLPARDGPRHRTTRSGADRRGQARARQEHPPLARPATRPTMSGPIVRRAETLRGDRFDPQRKRRALLSRRDGASWSSAPDAQAGW